MVCCTETQQSEQQTTQGFPSPLPLSSKCQHYSLNTLSLLDIPSSDMLYFKPSPKHYPSPFSSFIFS